MQVPTASRIEWDTDATAKCSACTNSRCRCIRIVESNSSCERCADQGLQCVVRISPETGQQEAREPEWPKDLVEREEHLGAPLPHATVENSGRSQDNVLSIAAHTPRSMPIKNPCPPRLSPHSSINSGPYPAGLWPTTPYHARLQSQQGYGWVKDWNLVQPQRVHPERRPSVQRIRPQAPHILQAPGQYHTVLLHPQDQRHIPPAGGFLARPSRSEANGCTFLPPPHPTVHAQQPPARQLHAQQIRSRQEQHRYYVEPAGPVSHFTGWGPLAGPRHLPQPQPQRREWQWLPPHSDFDVGGRKHMLLNQQHEAAQEMLNVITEPAQDTAGG